MNGIAMGDDVLCCRTVVAYTLPFAMHVDHPDLEVRLLHPDAISPQQAEGADDSRRLAFAVWEVLILQVPEEPVFAPRRITADFRQEDSRPETQIRRVEATFGKPLQDVIADFESLGTNCEFGLFQRRCGCEPLGLLRFAGLPYTHLLDGLDTGFAGIEDISSLSCHIQGLKPEWVVEQSTYEMRFHTFRSPSEVSGEALICVQSKVLAFRREKLLQLLSTGEKLFVVMRPEGLSASQALPLMTILRSYGPNALLFVSSDTGEPPGSVTALAPDFYRGSLDGIERQTDDPAVGNDTWLSDAGFGVWLSVCAKAFWFWKGQAGASIPRAR